MININRCYYINLPQREDRKKYIEEQIKKSQILSANYERFEAIDGYKVHPRELSNKNLLSEKAISDILMDNISVWGLSITQGALGVYLSYIHLFEIIRNSENFCIVLEDDSFLIENFDEHLSKIQNELPNDFDICYLGYGENEIENKEFSENLIIPTGIITCLPGLIISPKGAKKILSILENVSHQIDTEIYKKLGILNVFACKNKLAQVKNTLGSNIQGNKSCIKEYKKQNYIFSTLAYGDQANANALRLAGDLDFFKQKIVILTDKPESFVGFDNVIVKRYPKKSFSYNDKIFCFEEGFQYENAVVYLDADCRIFYEDFQKTFTNFFRIAKPGFHPSWNWGNVNKQNGFLDGKDVCDRVNGYGKIIADKCRELEIETDRAMHYQEGILILCKENEKEKDFLDIWKKLADTLDNYEIKMGSSKIGQGEGNLIGLAVNKAKLTIHSEEFANLLGKDIRYNFYGSKMESYISQEPNRKIAKNYCGAPLFSKNIDVAFEDKKIDLNYKIYQHSSGLLCLQFEWNKNNSIDFLDHEFKISDQIYHFNSDKFGNFYFKKLENFEIYHTYDWYGKKEWKKIL